MSRNSSKYLPPLIDYSASVTGVLESRCLEVVNMMAQWEADNNISKANPSSKATRLQEAKDLFSAELITEEEYEDLKKIILGLSR